MVINGAEKKLGNVEFVSYTGRYPNLCRGILVLKINGEIYTFGNDYIANTHGDFEKFWYSGGDCGFRNNYSESYINHGNWIIDASQLPEKLKKFAHEIDEVFNLNVNSGCCGGCL